LKAARSFPTGTSDESVAAELKQVMADPATFLEHPLLGDVAKLLNRENDPPPFVERETPAPYQIWGEGLEHGAMEQMRQSVRLPVAVQGALMPDAHLGYGLPIGGVLATENAVIPYAVGVDIACRMKLTVFDVPAEDLAKLHNTLSHVLQRETVFGTGGTQKKIPEHEVLD